MISLVGVISVLFIGCVIAGVAIYFDYKLLGVIGLCILFLARVTG